VATGHDQHPTLEASWRQRGLGPPGLGIGTQDDQTGVVGGRQQEDRRRDKERTETERKGAMQQLGLGFG
jgi:hypothetical protein